MKTKFYLLNIAILSVSLILSLSLHGQIKSTGIIPGEGGVLPDFKEIPKLEDGKFAGLFIHQITCDTYFANSGTFYVEVQMRYPEPETFGAEYYILERYNLETSIWENALVDGEIVHLTDSYNWLKWNETTKFRLKIKGGDKEGYTSNEEDIIMPRVPARIRGYALDAAMSLTGVMEGNVGSGLEVGVHFQLWDYESGSFVEGEVDENGVNEFDEFVVYEWYRRNEDTYEMELIEGANAKKYITTEDDLGYLIVSVIRGDDENASFYLQQESFSKVRFANPCYLDYLSDDGMIFNTYYSIPDFNKNTITIKDNFNNIDVELTEIIEIIPGRYKIKAALGFSNFNVVVNNHSWYLAPVRGEHFSSYFYFNIEESVLKIDVIQNENPANAEVELFIKRIDGDYIPYATKQTEDAKAEFETQTGSFILKVKEGENNLTSYFPNAALWYDAVEIEQPMLNHEWDDSIFVVELLPKPKPLPNTSNGVIMGQIILKQATNSQAHQAMKAKRNDKNAMLASNDVADIGIYLASNETKEILAITKSDNEGKYRFEHVPIGKYDILLDMIGLEMLSVNTVSIVDDDDIIEDVGYEISEDGIKSNTVSSIRNPSMHSLNIYPNPVQEELYIKSTNLDEIVVIHNITGEIVKKQELKNNKINVVDLESGLYIIQVGRYKSKFLKL